MEQTVKQRVVTIINQLNQSNEQLRLLENDVPCSADDEDVSAAIEHIGEAVDILVQVKSGLDLKDSSSLQIELLAVLNLVMNENYGEKWEALMPSGTKHGKILRRVQTLVSKVRTEG